MNGPINSGFAPFEYEAGNWSERAIAHAEAGFKAQERDLGLRLNNGTADLLDVCVYFHFCSAKPSVIRAMVKPEHRKSVMDIDADIRMGIHALAPSLDDCAYFFIAALVREYGATYADQVAA